MSSERGSWGMARGKVAAKGIGTDAAMLVPTTTRLCYPLVCPQRRVFDDASALRLSEDHQGEGRRRRRIYWAVRGTQGEGRRTRPRHGALRCSSLRLEQLGRGARVDDEGEGVEGGSWRQAIGTSA